MIGVLDSRICVVVLVMAGIGLTGGVHAKTPELSARQVMQRVVANLRLEDVQSNCRLTQINESGETRVRLTAGASKLKPNRQDMMQLIRFLEPADVRRTGLLSIQNTGGEDMVWLYLPALKKNRRITAAQKSGSFMGTELSYSDLDVPRLDEYRYQFAPGAGRDPEHFVVMITPVSDAVREKVGYHRMTSWIERRRFVQVRNATFDAAGKPLKTISASRYAEVDPKKHQWMAMRIEVVNHQNRKKTIAEFSNVRANTGLADSQFTLGYLERE